MRSSYDEAIVPVALTVRAHTTSALVWDVPPAVVIGEAFRVKVGIKCSSQCRQAHRDFIVVDDEGDDGRRFGRRHRDLAEVGGTLFHRA